LPQPKGYPVTRSRATFGLIGENDNASPERRHVDQSQLDVAAVEEETLATPEDNRMDPLPILVDGPTLHQRVHEIAAAVDQEILPAAASSWTPLGNIPSDHRRVPLGFPQGRGSNELGEAVHPIGAIPSPEDGQAAAKPSYLEAGTVTVAEQLVEVNGTFSVGPPKSTAGRRTVTLPTAVVAALAEHLANYTEESPDALVFLSSQGRHLRRSNFNRRVWQPATRAAGVEGLRVHDLRHTAGTLATAAGGSLREVMNRLGHSTTVAAVRYQHVMADRDAAIARELNRLIEGG
jgi:hypothetical protein